MSTVESIARPRRNGERRRAPTASISKESPAITGVVERSEERFSRNAETDLVCRLLLEKKKKISSLRHSTLKVYGRYEMIPRFHRYEIYSSVVYSTLLS